MQSSVLLPSVQSLFIELVFNDVSLATGTGFIATSHRGPVLVTNRHNLTGRSCETDQPLSKTGGIPNRVGILHNRKDRLGHWVSRFEPLLNNDGTPRWYEHPSLGSRADMVALPLTQLEDVHLFPYSLCVGDPEIRVAPSDTVSVVGFPFGILSGGALAIWATGFMASEPDIDHNGLPVFLIDCRARPGQSGSAVIAHRNGGAVPMTDGNTNLFTGPVTRFLGIYSGRINEQSDLGIVWKARAVKELIDAIP